MSNNSDLGLGNNLNVSVESPVDTEQNGEIKGGIKGEISKEEIVGSNVDSGDIRHASVRQVLLDLKKENDLSFGQSKDNKDDENVKFTMKSLMDKIGITQPNVGHVNETRKPIDKVSNETKESVKSLHTVTNLEDDNNLNVKNTNSEASTQEMLLDSAEDDVVSNGMSVKLDIADNIPRKDNDSIILSSLMVKMKVNPLGENPEPSPFTQSIMRKSAKNVKKKIPETTPDQNYYLDYSAYADYYNDPVEDTADTAEDISADVVKYRDYPMEDGYVRIPVFIPGLEMEAASEVPQLWNAQDAFMRQVGSKLYMFIPSAILGFIIGLLVWVVALAILRTFGLVKKTVIRVFKKQKSDEIDLKVKYVTAGDPWIKISDAERIHSVNGAIRKSVIGPCSPDKVVEFNQEVLEEVNRRTPGSSELGRLENEEHDEVFAGQGRRSWRVGGQRRSSN